MQRGDQSQRINMQCTTQPGLPALKGWWWDGCLFFDKSRHHKACLLARGTFLAKASLPYSANSSSSDLLFGVTKCPHDTINDYAQSMNEGDIFPPIIVHYDGKDYWLTDGFHRYHA